MILTTIKIINLVIISTAANIEVEKYQSLDELNFVKDKFAS